MICVTINAVFRNCWSPVSENSIDRNIDVTIIAVFRDRGPAVSENSINRNTYHLLYVITTDKTKSEKESKMLAITPESDYLQFCDDFFSGRHQPTAEVHHECSYPRMKRLNFT